MSRDGDPVEMSLRRKGGDRFIRQGLFENLTFFSKDWRFFVSAYKQPNQFENYMAEIAYVRRNKYM